MPNDLVYGSEKIIRLAGAGRVDEKASSKLASGLVDRGERIVTHAFMLARMRGRKNIKRKDIQLAAELILE